MIDKLIPYLKLGIKIKEKNKGSFTRYCNGKVTQECIDKGKKSRSKSIRKKAIFAENSRKFKHQKGGYIHRLDVKGLMNDPEYPKWKMNEKNLKIIQDSLVARGADFPERVAVLSQIIPESGGNTEPHGNEAYGLVGWRGDRAIGLPKTLSGQIHLLMTEIYDTGKNWNDGGKGSNVETGKEMNRLFRDTKNVDQATKAFMKGYVRPEKSEWNKRLALVKLIRKHMK